jgi:hypothetical protein
MVRLSEEMLRADPNPHQPVDHGGFTSRRCQCLHKNSAAEA